MAIAATATTSPARRKTRRQPARLSCSLCLDLRQAADEMAIAKWSAAHPVSELMIPDHADLVIWLLDQLAGVSHYEKTPDGIIDWKIEAERANRLYANIEGASTASIPRWPNGSAR